MPILLDAHIAHDPDGLAIVDDRGGTTWHDLGERINRWIDLLRGRGLGSGDRVACVLGNRRETFEVLLAALHSGVTVVPVNWHLTAPEIAYIVADSGSRALIVEDRYAPIAKEAAAAGGGDLHRLVLGDRDVEGFSAVEPMLAAADPRDPADQLTGATMLYTSGTTGAPKGVLNSLFVVGAPFSRAHRLTEYARVVLQVPARERFLLDGPWYHSSQLFFALLPLLLGSRLVIRPHFDPAETLATIDREQITSAHLVPTQLIRLLRLSARVRGTFSGESLRRVWHGGGPCPIDVKRQMIGWWGPILLEYYGATEGGAVTLIDSTDWLRRPGSVGQAVPPNEILIVDDDGDPMPIGRTGRVFLRRRRGVTFQYYNAPEKTQSAHLAPDTFTFGERGYVDEAGFLFLTGRSEDLIVTGGVNVYPAEVEAVLLAHSAVHDAVVLGVPDDEFGERVVAVVSPAPDAPTDLPTLLDQYCRRFLAGFKTPRMYHLVESLPREASGKIRRDALRRFFPATVSGDPQTLKEKTP